jgi:glycosyltransferase involved in cell wall biosynthesis
MPSTAETTPARVTGIIHARNAESTIERSLRSLRFVNELIVVDMESSDRTIALSEAIADRVVQTPLVPRVDGSRNSHLALARHEWIFVLDSDEYLAADAAEGVAALIARCGDRFDAVALPRFNYIADQVIRGSGWYPDHQVRLFRRGTVRWSDSHHQAPEVITGRGRVFTLTPPGCLHIHHLNYRDLRHFIRKQVDYALTDTYPDGRQAFDFVQYLAAAREQLALRTDPERDGDLSRALALLMAWDAVVRGLVHWDSVGRTFPLGDAVALPGAPRAFGWKVAVSRYLRTHHKTAGRLRAIVRPWRILASRARAVVRRDA